ncbi:MAG: NAD(P)H-dependent oxidoreductase [Lachnospiraceae bacterium]|nr:NAD(P)H-dependent oxidoreductase [Lachnospiraceae bacterium]
MGWLTYFMTMSGQMKIFIDRLLPEWQELGGKEVFVIVTGHDGKAGLKRTATDLVDIFDYLGNHVNPVIWGEGVWKKGEVLGTKAMDEAYQAGKKLGNNRRMGI